MVITNIKTPGVYVDEIPLFPPSVAQVATAIPAFIGYTQKAMDTEGKALAGAIRIKSLLEFNTYFGTAYTPDNYDVSVDTNTQEIKGAAADKRFFLYDCLRQFYDNGGGDCYIISVGDFDDSISASAIGGGIDQLKKYDEPTLIVFPDAVALLDGSDKPDFAALAGLQQKALALCATMQDRFTILDLMQGNLAEDPTNKPIKNFRDNLGINFLNYGAAYYPWIITGYDIPLSFRQLSFVKDTDGSDITNIDSFSNGTTQTQLWGKYKMRKLITDTFAKKLFTLPADINGFEQQRSAFFDLQLAALEQNLKDSAGAAYKTAFGTWLNYVAALVTAFPQAIIDTGIAADTDAVAAINTYNQNLAYTKAVHLLIALEKTTQLGANTPAARVVADVYANAAPAWAVAPVWTENVLFAAIDLATDFATYDTSAYTANKAGALAAVADIKTKILPAVYAVYEDIFFLESSAEKDLFASHAFFKGVSDKIKEAMCTLPPSGAIAGVYAMVDRTRGVWKAPANLSLSSVIGPSVKIDNQEQEDLNVHDTGKSINAIRAFTGKGTLVWGARTLAGNDNEWRYVPVRRFFIMVEESVKKASEPFVFEPNDANTWIKVKVMIENFLTLQWRAGALQGAKPEQAFFVNVGLGTTMSEVDILEGRMIVEIGMAAVRPAEFIILRFSHKMMEQ